MKWIWSSGASWLPLEGIGWVGGVEGWMVMLWMCRERKLSFKDPQILKGSHFGLLSQRFLEYRGLEPCDWYEKVDVVLKICFIVA